MSSLLAIFLTPVSLTRPAQLLMLLPLCLAVSLVYKTTKCENVHEIPWATLVSWVTIVIGMFAVGVVLLIAYELAT
jgi:hypothetical protein